LWIPKNFWAIRFELFLFLLFAKFENASVAWECTRALQKEQRGKTIEARSTLTPVTPTILGVHLAINPGVALY
jgi:hypothetical protein